MTNNSNKNTPKNNIYTLKKKYNGGIKNYTRKKIIGGDRSWQATKKN